MPESRGDEIIQRDLLGNPIERKIPRSVEQVAQGQTTLDNWMDKINNPGIEIEMIESQKPEKRDSKRRPWDKLIVNKGTRDEFILLGRYYTPASGLEIWSAPAERRDSYPKLKTEEGDRLFQVKGSDKSENGVRWTDVILIGNLPNGERGIKGYGSATWESIRTK